jgi:hypothetical protein
MSVSIVTPTGDRPLCHRLLAGYISRQDYGGAIEWITVDNGATPTEPVPWAADVVHHIYRQAPEGETPAQSFTRSMALALDNATGSAIVVCEDDDYYDPSHVSQMVSRLADAPVVGPSSSRYYHVGLMEWRRFTWQRNAALAQTAVAGVFRDTFRRVAESCWDRGSRSLDVALWEEARRRIPGLPDPYDDDQPTVVGIKGMPGRAGLGVGHDLAGRVGWTVDATALGRLREWIGADAEWYQGLAVDNHPGEME